MLYKILVRKVIRSLQANHVRDTLEEEETFWFFRSDSEFS